MIELRELTIGFSGRTVLDKIDLTIREGEITIIIGRSGCGKSVLMKSIEGLVKPVAGTILIDGVEITQLPEKELYRIRKKMAMLFQGSALLDSLNVYQNVALPLFEHTGGSAEEIRKVVTDNLELVGLPDILDRMPVELSGGMKKRVALARAMVMKPKYIIFDEPTTGLDPVIAAGINALILKLFNEFNITPVIITHDFDCIRSIRGRIIMIDQGKIIFDGLLPEFENSPLELVQKFQGKDI